MKIVHNECTRQATQNGTRRECIHTLRGTLEKFSSHLSKTEFNYECGKERRGKGRLIDSIMMKVSEFLDFIKDNIIPEMFILKNNSLKFLYKIAS